VETDDLFIYSVFVLSSVLLTFSCFQGNGVYQDEQC